MCKVFPLLRRVKRDTYCILVGDFEVRVRVRRVIRQKAHVRAKCVRGKASKCGVRACDGKFVALQHSGKNCTPDVESDLCIGPEVGSCWV